MERFLLAAAAEFASHDLDVAGEIANRLAVVVGHNPALSPPYAEPTLPHLATALAAPQAHSLAADLVRLSGELDWT